MNVLGGVDVYLGNAVGLVHVKLTIEESCLWVALIRLRA